MEEQRKVFMEFLESDDISGAIRHVLTLSNQRPIYEVYEGIINESMKEIGNLNKQGKYDIVSEHIFSNKIKTVIENCFEEVKRQSKPNNSKTVLVCALEDEYHEIGTRIICDYFRLAGYNTIYLGCNIPNKEIIRAVCENEIDYLAVSVTNFYHLNKLRDLVDDLKNVSGVSVFVGGQAISANNNYVNHQLSNVQVISNPQEIFNLEGIYESSI